MKPLALTLIALVAAALPHQVDAASVKPGDTITPDNASAVVDLVSPGNYELVKQGMRMNIVPTR